MWWNGSKAVTSVKAKSSSLVDEAYMGPVADAESEGSDSGTGSDGGSNSDGGTSKKTSDCKPKSGDDDDTSKHPLEES